MRRKGKYARSGKSDGGSSWISYSDMMAALLLLFVLVLCYSMYQYFSMLESKNAELEDKAAALSAQQVTLDEQAAQLILKQSQLDDQETELVSVRLLLSEQQGLLDSQTVILAQQQADIESSQLALSDKETELAAAYLLLSQKETDLEEATLLLSAQQTELDAATAKLILQQEQLSAQQSRLDDLVGVRTNIVTDLTAALKSANINAQVDPNTGDIVLESAVFFAYGKNEITDAGKTFLKKFIPVYLGVLLQDDYRDYLGEIIIEGHTDSSGSYLTNLKLSQERALSVTTYCLEMPGLTEEQRELFSSIVTATGKSYSNPVLNEDGTENAEASRRVEFKFRLKDSEMIDEIRQILSEGD